MSTELPLELWQLVSCFLDIYDLRRLLLVNRNLYYILRGLCYKTTCIGPPPSFTPEASNILRAPKHLQSLVAQWTTHLLFTCDKKSRRPRQSKLSRVVNVIRHLSLKKKQSEDVAKLLDRFSATVPALSSVISLTLDIGPAQDMYFPQRLKLLHISYPVLAENLRSLGLLNPTVEHISSLLPNLTLKRLESFAISMAHSRQSYNPDAFVLHDGLVRFLTTHRSTIRNLLINLGLCMAYSQLLSSLPHFPGLRKFVLVQRNMPVMVPLNTFEGHFDFLQKHRLHLKHLEIAMDPWESELYPSTSEWFTQPWQLIQYPDLSVLSLNIYDNEWTKDTDIQSTALFQHHIHQLTTLDFHQQDFTDAELSTFIMALAPSQLQKLSLAVASLSVENFCLLSEELPKLLLLIFIQSDPQIGHNMAKSMILASFKHKMFLLAKGMQSVDFSEWGLHTLSISYRFGQPPDHNLLRAAIFTAIPRLQYIDEVHRAVYASYKWDEKDWKTERPQ